MTSFSIERSIETSFVAFRLPEFRSNRRKRLEKVPNRHFYDGALVCWLPGIRTPDPLRSHPIRGARLEIPVVSEVAEHRLGRGETAEFSTAGTAAPSRLGVSSGRSAA